MLRNYLFQTEWNIGICKKKSNITIMDISAICDDKNIYWLKRKFHFQADPYLVEASNKLYVFYEALNYDWINGQIRCRILNLKFEELEDFPINDVNKLGCHLSFPAIYELENQYYLIPESYSANKLFIYKAINFPRQWEIISEIPNVQLVDTIMLKKDDYFLLISSQYGTLDRKVFFSEKIEGAWKPFEATFKIDNEHTRLGGNIFLVEDNYFLPCQNTDINDYGKCLWLKKVVIPSNTFSSEENWEEQTKLQMLSMSKKYPHGLHTLNFSQNFIVIDAKKWVFNPKVYIKNKINSILNTG